MDFVKSLTSKNKHDYELAASHIIDCADVDAFRELVSKDDFLFDFIKNNVSHRLENAVNSSNYLNLLKFFPHYTSSYADFIARSLAKFENSELTDKILIILEHGTDDEKSYCAKYFSYVKNSCAVDLLKNYIYVDFEPLALNSAEALSFQGDRNCFDNAVLKLASNDEFIVLSAVKFLVAFGDKLAIPLIFDAMRKSSLAETIAVELPYLENIFSLLNSDTDNALYLINLIIDGLGEVSALSQVFDYQLYDVLGCLSNNLGSREAVILLNARDKFNTLTENDEYLFDEDTNTKNEIFDIKKSLNSLDIDYLISLSENELSENSDFVFTAVDFAKSEDKLLNLTLSSNQTLILKVLSTLKMQNKLDLVNKDDILLRISDENIRAIILAL